MSNRRHDSQAGDRLTKQAIVFTVCGILGMFAWTICRAALLQVPIPDPLDRAFMFIAGMVGGWLGKTGVDNMDANRERRATDPAEGATTTTSVTTSRATVTTATDGGDDETTAQTG